MRCRRRTCPMMILWFLLLGLGMGMVVVPGWCKKTLFDTATRNALLNMTDVYRGTWSSGAQEQSWPQGERPNFPGAHRTSGMLSTRLRALPFPEGGPNLNIIEGDIRLFEGEYANDPVHTYSAFGFLNKDSGTLQLLATPFGVKRDLSSTDFFGNHTQQLMESVPFQRASRQESRQGTGDGKNYCVLIITMRAKVAQDMESQIASQQAGEEETTEVELLQDQNSMETPPGNAIILKNRDRKPAVKDISLAGVAVAQDSCQGMNITLQMETVQLLEYTRKTSRYSLLLTVITCLQILVTIGQTEHTRSHSNSTRVSAITIGHQAVLDAYMCLFHLTSGILIDPIFNTFATTAFFKFVLFGIFELRFVLSLWKAQNPPGVDEDFRSLSTKVYTRFYACLLGGVFLAYNFSSLISVLFVLLYSFWVPQIIRNVWRDSQHSLSPKYVIVMTVTRMFVPAYLLGCPDNFFKLRPNWTLLIVLLTVLLAQMAFLLSQHYFGSRWFVPAMWLPAKFTYFQPDAYTSGPADMDCAICMHALDPVAEEHDVESAGIPVDSPDDVRARVARRRRQVTSLFEVMCTPCRHVYHTECLRQWMELKLECPSCRAQLPEE